MTAPTTGLSEGAKLYLYEDVQDKELRDKILHRCDPENNRVTKTDLKKAHFEILKEGYTPAGETAEPQTSSPPESREESPETPADAEDSPGPDTGGEPNFILLRDEETEEPPTENDPETASETQLPVETEPAEPNFIIVREPEGEQQRQAEDRTSEPEPEPEPDPAQSETPESPEASETAESKQGPALLEGESASAQASADQAGDAGQTPQQEPPKVKRKMSRLKKIGIAGGIAAALALAANFFSSGDDPESAGPDTGPAASQLTEEKENTTLDQPEQPETKDKKGLLEDKPLKLSDGAFKTAGSVKHEDITYIHLPVPALTSVEAYKTYLDLVASHLDDSGKTLSAEFLSNNGVQTVASPHVMLIPDFLLENMSADTQRDMARLVEYAVADSQRATEHYGSSEKFAYVFKMDGNKIRLIRDQNADLLNKSGPNDNQPLAQYYSPN